MFNKNLLLHYLRKLGMMQIADKLKFYYSYLKNLKIRKQFKEQNPGIELPPAYYIYETFNLNYFSFYNKGIDTVKWLLSYFTKYKELENLNILDWGCGPGRLIRHLPDMVPPSCNFYGTDYNKKYINWCKKNIPDANFKHNGLKPPLAYPDEFFDIIYGISIFTHLSEAMHYQWFSELMRVTKKGGILFLTMHGAAFKSKLSPSENLEFDKGNIVVKANTKEGHRTFGAFHPVPFVKKLAVGNEILEHVPGEILNNKAQQDVWIVRKV